MISPSLQQNGMPMRHDDSGNGLRAAMARAITQQQREKVAANPPQQTNGREPSLTRRRQSTTNQLHGKEIGRWNNKAMPDIHATTKPSMKLSLIKVHIALSKSHPHHNLDVVLHHWEGADRVLKRSQRATSNDIKAWR